MHLLVLGAIRDGYIHICPFDNEVDVGDIPRVPQDNIWATPSEVAQPTRSRHVAHVSVHRELQVVLDIVIVLNRIFYLVTLPLQSI
jgi:hypothetical protein